MHPLQSFDVLFHGVYKPCNISDILVTPLMKGQARNIWRGTQTTRWHSFCSLFYVEHSLTYFLNCRKAYRNFLCVICVMILAFHPECSWVIVTPKSAINTPKWENYDPCPFNIGVFSSPGLAYLIHPSTELKLQGGSLRLHVVYCKHGSHGPWKVIENWKIVGCPWEVL